MQRNKILIFIDWFLPGTNSGGPVRSYANMIAHLGNYHDFLIITRDTDFCMEEPYKNIQSNAWNSFNDHTQIYYISKDKLTKQTLKKLVNETQFDIAYINGIYSWYFSILPLFLLDKTKKVIVSSRGMLNPQAFSVKSPKKKLFLKLAKLMGLYKNVMFHATNDQEKEHIINEIGLPTEVLIAPNLPRTIDHDYSLKQKNEVTKFVNLARVSIEKGTLKMIEAFNNIESEVVLDIYGPIYDAVYWNLCKREIASLPTNVTVNYNGIAESEMVPVLLRQYDFFIMPSEGENFGHSILEALSVGLPVLISNMTPWKNLKELNVGWDIALENKDEFTDAINYALNMEQDEYVIWSQAAFDYANTFINDPETFNANRKLFKSH